MKKFINLSLIICTLILCTHAVKAVLTNQAPAKHQNTYTTPTQSARPTSSGKTASMSEIEAYKKKVSAMIDADVAKWRPLIWSNDLSTEIEFGIAENGRLNYSVVTKSSGQHWFDDSAKSAALQIYDPLPESFQGYCPRMERTSYGTRKCLVMTHTIKQKAKMPEGYVKPKQEIEKTQDDHIKDMQKSSNGLF